MDHAFIKKLKIILRIIQKNKSLAIIIQFALIAGAVYLAVVNLKSDGQITDLRITRPGFVILGALFYLSFYLVLAMHWLYALRLTNPAVNKKQLLAFFASQPYKYLPSSIFSMSSRSIYSKKIGVRLISTVKAQINENASLFISGLVLILLIKLPIFYGAGLLITSVAIFLALAKKAKHIKYLWLIILALFAWAISGAAFLLIIKGAGGQIDYAHAVYLNTLTFLASIAAVFVPAGIGVREAILFSQSINFSGVILWRICTFMIDILSGLAAIIYLNKKKFFASKSD